MSETYDTSNPVLSFMGGAFLFLVPVALVAMIGYIGFEFLRNAGPETPKSESGGQVAAAASPPSSAGAGGGGESGSGGTSGGGSATEAAAKSGSEGGGASSGGIDSAVMKLGKSAYATCAACHGPDGTGMKTGPMKMAPSLVGSELLLGDPDKSLLIVLKGIKKEGMDYMGVMAPLASSLDDKKLAAVLTYARNSWGNGAPPVTPQQAAKAREKFADVEAAGGVARDRIDQIVSKHQ